MKPRSSKNKFANINRIYGLALLISLVFLAISVTFILHANRLSQEETLGYIKAAIQQTKFDIEANIQEEFDTLMAAATVAQDRDLLADDEVLFALLKGLYTHNTYVQIGFANTKGNAVWLDQYDRKYCDDLSAEGYIQRALLGENALSRIRSVPLNGLDIHYFAVPIYDGKTDAVEGVLFAAVTQQELRTIIDRSLHAGVGLAHIIDSQGNYILKSDSPLVIGIGNNIFQIGTPISKASQQEILDNLSAGKPGHLVRSFYGENRLIAYAPLAINDWHVFYAVPENMVSAGLKYVTTGTIVIVAIATGIFILFVLLLHKINAKNRKALETLAFVDPITEHNNFHKFLVDAKEILFEANGTHYAIWYAEIKNLKFINDLYGRDLGDRLLRYMADFLQATLDEGEVAGRVNSDSFVALYKYHRKKELEFRFASAIHHMAIFPETFSKGYKVDIWGGVYMLDAKDGDLSINDMLDRAIAAQEDGALSGETKRFCFYSNEMREKKLWETELETHMEEALENNEFRVYLQPKIDIQQGNRIFGAEALVRWASYEKGMLLPARFIDLFEKNGFIVELDRFVFESVCWYYKENVLEGKMPALVLSVNVSRHSLMQPNFIQTYTSIKQALGIPDNAIELEFTESLVFRDQALFRALVADCKRSGFLCSMDDFGSGYSSLNTLKSIHVDVLKLDKQFFRHDDDAQRGRELVKHIISMAESLHMRTVAEGVDDMAQVEELRQMGCDAVQGYVFAKPMPMEQFKPFIEAWDP